MIRNFKIIMLFMVALSLLSACHKVTSEGLTRTTNLPTIELVGDPIMVVKAGTFVDPGVVAMEGDKDISADVKKTNTTIQGDPNVAGSYTITYVATNVDGFTASVSRDVVVYAASGLTTEDIAGMYDSNVLRDGNPLSAAQKKAEPPYAIEVDKEATGVFYISDLLGGWYDQGRAYGPGYAGEGVIQIKADNSVEIIWSSIPSWGTYVELVSTTPSTYNSTTHTLTISVQMSDAPYNFVSTMVLH